MNFDLPLPKEKKHHTKHRDSFPVTSVPADDAFHEKQFKGYFTGLNVEVYDEDSIKTLYKNGCFGTGTRTKTCPRICYDDVRVQCITPQQLEQKLKWKEEFGNKNPNIVMVKLLVPDGNAASQQSETVSNASQQSQLLPKEGTSSTEMKTNDEMETSSQEETIADEPTLIEDPFPIEEALALMLEEAFFLHSSLKCLKIVDFDDTKEFTTDEIIDLFCDLDAKFIQRFVAYQYYRGQNWVVKSGLKFGGDFLLYDKGPEFTHASYVVLVNDNEDAQNHLDVQSNYRVSDTTGKNIIIVKITRPNGLNYTDYHNCFKRFTEFTVTEEIPKRLQVKQLTTQNQ